MSAAYVVPAQSERGFPDGRALSMSLTSTWASAAAFRASAIVAVGQSKPFPPSTPARALAMRMSLSRSVNASALQSVEEAALEAAHKDVRTAQMDRGHGQS